MYSQVQELIVVGLKPRARARHGLSEAVGSSDGKQRGFVARREQSYSVPDVLKVVVGRLCLKTEGSQWSEIAEPPLEDCVEAVAVVVLGDPGTIGTPGGNP